MLWLSSRYQNGTTIWQHPKIERWPSPWRHDRIHLHLELSQASKPQLRGHLKNVDWGIIGIRKQICPWSLSLLALWDQTTAGYFDISMWTPLLRPGYLDSSVHGRACTWCAKPLIVLLLDRGKLGSRLAMGRGLTFSIQFTTWQQACRSPL